MSRHKTKETARKLVGLPILLPMFIACAGDQGDPSSTPARASGNSQRQVTPEIPLTSERDSETGGVREELQQVLDAAEFPAAAVVLHLETDDVVHVQTGAEHSFRRAHRPASTVKPLLYAAAIDGGKLSAETKHECTGSMPEDPDWRCFQNHGLQMASDAIASSCNTFAWHVIDDAGYSDVRAAFEMWGFGKKTGLAPGEVAGFVPRAAPDDDQDSFARMTGFGHGDLRVTPLQLAVAYGKLAGRVTVEPEKYALIRDGLRQAVETGTAAGAHIKGASVWGKTGSAENLESGGEKMDGWFVGWVPGERPTHVFATHVLGGGGAMKTAVPLTKELIEVLLNQQ